MHRLVPEFIQEQYVNNKIAGSFDACTLFVDVSGFTPITDAIMGYGQHGAEVLANIIQDVFDPLIQSVFEQGGFVTNLAGDAFTSVFLTDGESPNGFDRALAAGVSVPIIPGIMPIVNLDQVQKFTQRNRAHRMADRASCPPRCQKRAW